MTRKAFLYPGQGSQKVGMGVSLRETYSEAADIFERASELAGYDMFELCSTGPQEKLSRTLYTQPALFTVEAAITDVMKAKGIHPDAAAGHSLGEFSAWYAAGAYSFEDGFTLVSERALLMDGADPDCCGTMSAVIGLTRDEVVEVCESVGGILVVANCNSPSQQVISGEKDAVVRAEAILKDRGAKRVIPLQVSGAFHAPLMEKACDSFHEAVEHVNLCDTCIPVYSNVEAAPVTKADEIRQLMEQQLLCMVRWTETIRAMGKDGISVVYETGPGTVLSGLVKRIDSTFTIIPVSDASGVERAYEQS